MTSLWQNDSTTIGRVTIRSRVDDPLAAQHRVANLLRSADMRQSRLPPSAILFVRKLQDPLPDTNWLNTTQLHLPQAWEQAVTRELDRLASVAIRPVFDAVPPSAEAVAFWDRAELLACLTEDWLSGTLRANWWWRTLLRSGDLNLVVMREWERSPELAAVGVELLQRRSLAQEFVRRLPAQCTVRLLAGMLHAHGLTIPPGPPPQPTPPSPSKTPAAGKTILTLPTPTRSVADPWLPWVPEASAGNLPTDARLFLAYALLLTRAPDIVRAPVFGQLVSEWRERIATSAQQAESSPAASKTRPSPRLQTHRNEGVPNSEAGGPHPSGAGEVHSAKSASLAEDHVDTPATSPTANPGSLSKPGTPQDKDAAAEKPAPSIDPLDEGVTELPAQGLSSEPSTPKAAAPSVRQELAPTEIETEFGGAFFLLNMALYLDLYGDFTKPCHRGLELNIWDFVAQFGLELGGPEFVDDPVWPLLADLAGRHAGHKPADDFHPPEACRIPPEWLEAFPGPEPWRAIVGKQRLRLIHPEGFAIVDVPLAGRAKSHAIAQELQPYSATISNIREDYTETAETPLTRWTTWMRDYLRSRLIRALGRTDAAQLLCRIPARVRTTPAHLHVLIPLGRHPIEIRLAALDRDPGWIPAAGRYVAFHFN